MRVQNMAHKLGKAMGRRLDEKPLDRAEEIID